MALNIYPAAFTIYPNAARTAAPAAFPIKYNENGYRGVRLYFDVTAITATPSITMELQVQDPVGKDWLALLVSAALTAVITAPVIMTIYPDVTAAVNVALSSPIGRLFRVVPVHGDADSINYSVSGEWLV